MNQDSMDQGPEKMDVGFAYRWHEAIASSFPPDYQGNKDIHTTSIIGDLHMVVDAWKGSRFRREPVTAAITEVEYIPKESLDWLFEDFGTAAGVTVNDHSIPAVLRIKGLLSGLHQGYTKLMASVQSAQDQLNQERHECSSSLSSLTNDLDDAVETYETLARVNKRIKEENVRFLKTVEDLLDFCQVMMSSRKELNGQLRLVAALIKEEIRKIEQEGTTSG